MPFFLLIIKKEDYEKNTITYRNYWGGTTFIYAQGDYYIKKAQSYQREAEYYQKKAEGYRKEATYYLKKAEGYQREAAYYTKRGEIDRAKSNIRTERWTTGYIATAGVGLADIILSVDGFTQYAMEHPELNFLVTRIGCRLGGWQVP